MEHCKTNKENGKQLKQNLSLKDLIQIIFYY
jgi:hypothetical protein